jgi:ribosomal-protein-serine acetyltransferase
MDFPGMPIVTERLVLRPWEDDDVDALTNAVTANIDHLRPWMSWIDHEPMSREQRLELIARFRAARLAGDDLTLGIFHNGEAVGGTGLHPRIGASGVEIGYWIHVDHLRKGFATEAAGALADAALALPHIDHVQIHHDVANVASAGVPQRLGFVKVGEDHDGIQAPAECGVEWIWEMRSDQRT